MLYDGRKPVSVEWPTLAVAVAIYGGFGLLTWYFHQMPWWLVLPLGGYWVAWHGSLQHEVVHGHPTRSQRFNEALVFPSLWLWLPFSLYRDSHLTHHNDVALTDPVEDPESTFVARADWAQRGLLSRAGLWTLKTLAGRLLLGPFFCVWRVATSEVRRLWRGDSAAWRVWTWHAVSCGLVLGWTWGVCGIPVLEYILFFAYPGTALTLMRSFLEHQARENVGERTAIVESGPILSLMYLNNNLHTLHHLEPGTPWYRLPQRYRAKREKILEHNGGYLVHGYRSIALRYLLWPKESPVHPLT